MELYTTTSYEAARLLTLRYSTSFGQSSKLFAPEIRDHIYAIYALVRIADEIVDTYQGKDASKLLKDFEAETFAALRTGYSTNPIIHAFVTTAKRFTISRDLLRPFFKSMRMDLKPQTFSKHTYAQYIYGSAEVIGLMCLKVFCDDATLYKKLEPGARALGVAYQKVNFLRDVAADYHERGRVYFPGVTFESLNEKKKAVILRDIKKDFAKAEPAVAALPVSARKAVSVSYAYYSELLSKLERTPVDTIKTTRIRVSTPKKLQLFIGTALRKGTA